jgi:hypothetical protein
MSDISESVYGLHYQQSVLDGVLPLASAGGQLLVCAEGGGQEPGVVAGLHLERQPSRVGER